MKFAVTGNPHKPGLCEAVAMLLSKLKSSNAGYLIDRKILNVMLEGGVRIPAESVHDIEGCVSKADVLVAFGGDGTILAAARAAVPLGVPILGVNLGKLGFLAEIAPGEMEQAIGDILSKKYVVEERLVLQATSPNIPGKVFYAINDIVVDKARSPRVIDVETHINGDFAVTYRGDGLIISTPTGSTAYALSNGGPIVIPTSSVIGITPISPHSLSGRPLIVPQTSVIRVIAHAENNEVLISADGQTEAIVNSPAEVLVRRAEHWLKLVKRVDLTYFDVLRAKLLWGKDGRLA